MIARMLSSLTINIQTKAVNVFFKWSNDMHFARKCAWSTGGTGRNWGWWKYISWGKFLGSLPWRRMTYHYLSYVVGGFITWFEISYEFFFLVYLLRHYLGFWVTCIQQSYWFLWLSYWPSGSSPFFSAY